jgi:hypothetical protein
VSYFGGIRNVYPFDELIGGACQNTSEINDKFFINSMRRTKCSETHTSVRCGKYKLIVERDPKTKNESVTQFMLRIYCEHELSVWYVFNNYIFFSPNGHI